MFSGHWGDRRRFLFLLCQISLLALGGFLEVRIADDVVAVKDRPGLVSGQFIFFNEL
jgi:hypothetical protein